MRGIAAARAQQARSQLAAFDAYAGTIGQAIGRALALRPVERVGGGRTAVKRALILFCAEQGFAGAFSEHALNFAGDEIATSELYLIGSRGAAIDRVDIVFNQWRQAQRTHVERRSLFPLDWAMFNAAEQASPPLTHLKPETLLAELTFAYMHAQLCNAALYITRLRGGKRGAHGGYGGSAWRIERNLNSLLSIKRILRQEEITAEILELAAGVAATAGFASRIC
jgi:F-type H+-transporting ATPase subunit gamma